MSPVQITDATVCKLIASVLPRHLAKERIGPETNLRQDLDVDSLGLMTIVFALEEGLAIELSSFADRLADAASVADIIAIVRTAAQSA